MLQEAKHLLAKGISVIPILGRSVQDEESFKRPALQSWKEYQTRRPSMQEVETWFKFSRYNLGLVTGQISRVFCLDVDNRHNGHISVQGKQFPHTWQDKSPNGGHYYFRLTPELNIGNLVNLLPGVDIRGNGGYVIIPPSVGYNGSTYEWIRSPYNTPLAYPPSWLLGLLSSSSKSSTSNKPGWIGEALASVAEGSRNNTFAKIIGRLWYDGWTEGDIFEFLKPKADEVEFATDELELIIKSISARPRTPESLDVNEDAVDLSSFMDSDEEGLKWYVDNIIPEQSVTILGGMQGLGKTWLMLDLAIELARGGGSWLNKFSVNPSNVIYVDEESSSRLLRHRLKKLLVEKGLKAKDLQLTLSIGKNLNFSNEQSVEKFKRLLDKVRPGVVFIDSLVRVHKGNENSSTEMAQVFNVVKKLTREFNCSFIFADHENKGVYQQDPEHEKDPSSNDLRGSNEKGAFADTVLNLRKQKGDLFLYHTKSRYCEAQLPVMVKIEDDGDTKIAVRSY
jgi:KaiC/GvpD/RAD55 family RecA-like ATPase